MTPKVIETGVITAVLIMMAVWLYLTSPPRRDR